MNVRSAAWVALVGFLCAGCAKKAGTVALEDFVAVEERQTQGPKRPEVVGPIHWWDASGLCLDVPEGWQGLGQDGDRLLLSLGHQAGGVTFEISAGRPVAIRPGFTKVFSDAGRYRDLPALADVGVESWVSEEPGGASLQVWTGAVGDRLVTLEATYPFGQVIAGTHLIEGLFRGICVE